MPDRQAPRGRPDAVTLLVAASVLAVLLGGYLGFPWLLRTVQRADCIATGRFTDC